MAALGAFCSGLAGLLISFHLDLPGGPAIVLVAGLLYLLSLLLAPAGLFGRQLYRRRHLTA